ncbi:MAG: MazG family protein [Verrucomicrobiales bacterium]|jgi:MazG family protein
MPEPTPVAIDEPDPTLAIPRLREIVSQLRAPGGCPWDIEQTHQSLIPNLLEEAYEAAEAIRSGDRPHMCEELGDLMLQAVMHAQIADEAGDFNLDDVATGIADKLVRRHPHVFGESDADNTEAVLAQWDEIKKAEKAAAGKEEKSPSALDGVPVPMPAIMRANELQKKAAKVGFDWEKPEDVVPKVREEIDEITEAMSDANQEHIADEIGDLLFAAVNLARKLKIDPEAALTAANDKFTRRFQAVESHFTAAGTDLKSATLEQMDAAWDTVKAAERP